MKSFALTVALTALGSATLVSAGKKGIAWPYFETTDVSEVYNNGAVSWVYSYEHY